MGKAATAVRKAAGREGWGMEKERASGTKGIQAGERGEKERGEKTFPSPRAERSAAAAQG